MSIVPNKSSWRWTPPLLDRRGQELFWDNQASSYDKAQMTNDNSEEMDVVIDTVKQGHFDEIITFGGAVGCRDPKMILEQMYCNGCVGGNGLVGPNLPKVVFNDLSLAQVNRAKSDILAPCKKCGLDIDFSTGPIHEAAKLIRNDRPKRNRMLLLGLYTADAFFRSDPAHGYPLCGFDEYLTNSAILGEHFWFNWVSLGNTEIKTSGGLEISAGDSPADIQDVKVALAEQYKQHLYRSGTTFGDVVDIPQICALQIVGVHKDRPGFFISHWYAPMFDELLKSIFYEGGFTIDCQRIAKGNLYAITPTDQRCTGVITMLNNVLGNILPHEQIPTLNAIKGLVKMLK